MTRLREIYNETIRPSLLQDLELTNPFEAPKLEKVVINVGVGDAKDNQKGQTEISENLKKITGQQPVLTKAKKSIAGFKIRTGQPIGLRVTLRADKMYDFLDKLINVALPRLRDFRGLSSKGFDGHGNYNLGIKEQVIFPEIHFDLVERLHGLNITIVTDAKSDHEAQALLTKLGFPFEK